jgi:hypothetical protein
MSQQKTKLMLAKNALIFTGWLKLSTDSNNSFFINAFGNPDDGYNFRGSVDVTNMSIFQSLNLENQHIVNQFCLKAIVSSNSTSLLLQSSVCYDQIGAICQKRANKLPSCDKTSTKTKGIIDTFSDPILVNQFNEAAKYLKNKFKSIFEKENKTTGFKGTFSLLWSSGLPCFDLNGITSLQDGEKSLLKSCFWKGVKIPCAAIFSTFPTDQGMCCSFNMKAADEIFQQATYSELVLKANG